jgi:hypothetical protein
MTTGRNLVQDQQIEGGRVFREAWIAGVTKHYPGEPKTSYISPWADTPDWERAAATAVYDQVLAFIRADADAAAKLTRSQKGRLIALLWVGQIYKHIPNPKPGYVADWDDLPQWQRETDSDIFERIEQDSWRQARREVRR